MRLHLSGFFHPDPARRPDGSLDLDEYAISSISNAESCAKEGRPAKALGIPQPPLALVYGFLRPSA
jgi:hypothetical protein